MPHSAGCLAGRTSKSAKLVYDARELETGRNFSGSHLAAFYRRIWALPKKSSSVKQMLLSQ